MMLGVLYVLLALAAAAAVSSPWWRKSASMPVERRRANVAAYRSRIEELQQEQSAGSLDAQTAAELSAEMQARLVADAGAPAGDADERISGSVHRWPAVWVGVLLPAFAAAWYWQAGSWRIQDQIALNRSQPPQDVTAASVEAMVSGLQAKLRQNPEDAEGWALLARSYYVMQRYGEAAAAYTRANALVQPAQPDLLVMEGESLALSRDRVLSGRPRELFEQALALDANHARALWFAGLSAVQAEEHAVAQQRWEKLLQQELPEDLREDLKLRVAELAKLVPNRLTGRVSEPAQTTAAAEGLALRLTVDIAPDMAGKFRASDTLFVYARAAGGPPMPLAIQKLPAGGFPRKVILDDSQGMMPNLKLSQFDRWIVTARVSASGQAQPQSGDLQGEITLVRAQAGEAHELFINTSLP